MTPVRTVARSKPAAEAETEAAAPVGAGLGGRKLRVLLSAEACNPSWSSVPLVGYNIARALTGRDDLDVTLVTNVRNKDALECDPLRRETEIHYIDNDFIAGPFFRFARKIRGGITLGWTLNTALMWPSYMVYERMIYQRFGRDLRRGRFDLIHRVTPVTPVLGSPLTSWTDVPMVIGPLNGGLPWPEEFPKLRRLEREWLIPFRRLHTLLPYHQSTAVRAAGLIAASRHTASELAPGPGARFYLPENGVDPARFPLAEAWNPPPAAGAPFRFITVGRLAPVKVIDLILRAMSASEILRSCRLMIVGDGPERDSLHDLTRSLGLESVTEFVGWIDQTRLAECLRGCQAFVFPSIKDFGGGAVLEAMASALPAIVADYGGPSELVTNDTGIRLPIEAADDLVVTLRTAMERLAADHALCGRLGAAAARRVREQFTWSAKAERIVTYYHEVLRRRALAEELEPEGTTRR